MKHIKKFNEDVEWMDMFTSAAHRTLGLAIGHFVGVLLLLGLINGYPIVQKFINFISFNRAASKIAPIFDKIKDDEQIYALIEQLKDLIKDRDDSDNPFYLYEGEKSKLVKQIYKRASEILDESEFEILKSATEEFSKGAGQFSDDGTYFYNKDSKFSK
jgi:hypothetical protein